MTLHRTEKQVVVIGAGLHGLCTAWYLAQAGCQVAVIDRHRHVTEGSTLGNSGMMHPSICLPWQKPRLRRSIFSGAMQQHAPVLLNGGTFPRWWKWLKNWRDAGLDTVYKERVAQTLLLARYNQHLLTGLLGFLQMDIEQTDGLMQVFRTQSELDAFIATADILSTAGIQTDIVDADEARKRNHALHESTPLAGAGIFTGLAAGNAVLMGKLLKSLEQGYGVQFYFGTEVTGIHASTDAHRPPVILELDSGESPVADAVVMATGLRPGKLHQQLRLSLPVQSVKTITATVNIIEHNPPPPMSLYDPAYRTGISLIGRRVRLSGTIELGARHPEPDPKAIGTLLKVAREWYPNIANYHHATWWTGHIPFNARETPLFGSIAPVVPNGGAYRNVFLNTGHGVHGWSTALATARLIADQITGQTPEIETDRLRLQP